MSNIVEKLKEGMKKEDSKYDKANELFGKKRGRPASPLKMSCTTVYYSKEIMNKIIKKALAEQVHLTKTDAIKISLEMLLECDRETFKNILNKAGKI